jgi:hypothetical protein
MKMPAFKLLAMAALSMSAFGANAADANVTNNVIFGSGNSNGGFTVDTSNGIEVGIRAKMRYPSPSDSAAGIGSNGDGTYNQAAGGFTSGGGVGGTRAGWNFDWSINTDPTDSTGKFVGDYTYLLSLDFDPSFGTGNWQTFNPINGTTTCADHSFGNNSTAANAGAEVNCAAVGSAAAYSAVLGANSLVQQSWNFDFFDSVLFPFDPNAAGNYNIKLEVFDTQQNRLAGTSIEVIVGGGYVPEPGSLALVGLALAGLATVRRRKA